MISVGIYIDGLTQFNVEIHFGNNIRLFMYIVLSFKMMPLTPYVFRNSLYEIYPTSCGNIHPR